MSAISGNEAEAFARAGLGFSHPKPLKGEIPSPMLGPSAAASFAPAGLIWSCCFSRSQGSRPGLYPCALCRKEPTYAFCFRVSHAFLARTLSSACRFFRFFFLVRPAFFPASFIRFDQSAIFFRRRIVRTARSEIRSRSSILCQLGHRITRFAKRLFERSPSICATSKTASTPKPQ